jgi:hypothetical protein
MNVHLVLHLLNISGNMPQSTQLTPRWARVFVPNDIQEAVPFWLISVSLSVAERRRRGRRRTHVVAKQAGIFDLDGRAIVCLITLWRSYVHDMGVAGQKLTEATQIRQLQHQ